MHNIQRVNQKIVDSRKESSKETCIKKIGIFFQKGIEVTETKKI